MKRGTQKDRVFVFIKDYIALHGYGPSVREICEDLGLRSTATIHYHLQVLEREGKIVKTKGKKRVISVPMEEADNKFNVATMLQGGMDRLIELAQADAEGRIIILPCKPEEAKTITTVAEQDL